MVLIGFRRLSVAHCDYTANAFVMSLIKVSFGSMITNARLPASRTGRRIVPSSAFSGGMNSALGFNALPVGKVPCRNHQPWVQWVHRSYICPACTIHYPIRRCSRHTRCSTINNAAYDKFLQPFFLLLLIASMHDVRVESNHRRTVNIHSKTVYASICARIMSEHSMRIHSHAVPFLTMAMVPVLFSNGASFS